MSPPDRHDYVAGFEAGWEAACDWIADNNPDMVDEHIAEGNWLDELREAVKPYLRTLRRVLS